MTRIRIIPYKMSSESAKLIAQGLGGLRTRSVSLYKPRGGDLIINWGTSTDPPWFGAYRAVQRLGLPITFLNKPEAVARAVNKLTTFRVLRENRIATPEFTTDREEVLRDWDSVFARHKLTGHSGEGIEYVGVDEDVPLAPLYTRPVWNHGEYRVHVVNGEVIDYTKKRRHNGDEAGEDQLEVRNLASGWIYTRGNLRRLDRVEDIAIRAVSALGLDFGAVDVIKDENGDVFVLEVNCACGLGETALDSYLTAFRTYIPSLT